MRERYTNAADTQLDGSINNSTTTVVVDDASTFPTAAFRILVESEIMFCTSRSSNTLTVVRAQEGTAAASHADNVPVTHLFTAGALDQYRRDLLADAGMIDSTDSASADDDDFDNESFSGWTTVQGTPNITLVEKNHRASVFVPSGSASAQHYGFVKAKSVGVGNYVQAGFQMSGGAGQFPIAGVVMSDGATYNSGKQVCFTFSPNENQYFLRGLNTWNANATQTSSAGILLYLCPILHLRMEFRGSNAYTCYASVDCINWATIFSNTSCHTVGTPTHAGFICTTWGSSSQFVHSFSYCRFSW